MPAAFHESFRSCLRSLRTEHCVDRFDITQPMGPGTPLARTRVTRCVIGEPGITYKYLGLRMFAYPWRGDSATEPLLTLRKLSRKLTKRAEKNGGADAARSEFNIVLLNRMAPEDEEEGKPEKVFGMGAVSVSWHADSSLQDFSTISVYVAEHDAGLDNFPDAPLDTGPAAPRKQPWQVALRVVRDVEGPTMRAKSQQRLGAGLIVAKQDDTTTPALRIPMHDGECYHMSGNFNHHHQHAILQGRGAVRYSSTHRVAVEEGHTYQSIRSRCLAALEVEMSNDVTSATAGTWQEEQFCLSEVEFEWLRQWYVQGTGHAEALSAWWQPKIGKLEALWARLEQRTCARMSMLQERAAAVQTTPGGGDMGVLVELCVVLKGALSRRQRLRSAWASRERDPIFASLADAYRPMACLHAGPSPPADSLPAELTNAVAEVTRLEKLFSASNKASRPCRFLVKFGSCNQGAACPFSHTVAGAPPPQVPVSVCADVATSAPVVPVVPEHVRVVTDDDEARREWPFADTEFGDHFETPEIAYRHVRPLLRLASKAARVDSERLRIYDPYYCRGHIVGCLNALGYSTVIHAKRDFYADIAAGKVPSHDVLLTNPPYSGDHKERFFRYVLDAQKAATAGCAPAPFLFLLPAWTASKLAWRQLLWCLAELRNGNRSVQFQDAARGERGERVGAFSDKLEEAANCFYLVPAERYQFLPAVAAREEAPFDGVWFCGGFASTDECRKAVERASSRASANASSAAPSLAMRVLASLAEIRAEGVLPTAEEARKELPQEDLERRKRSLAALDESRSADPQRQQRKRQKQNEQRQTTAARADDSNFGEQLSTAARQLVLDTPRACKHFFGLVEGKGCTRGASCKFLHRLEGVN